METRVLQERRLRAGRATDDLRSLKLPPRGRPPGLDARQSAELTQFLKKGALSQGFSTELWTLRRVRQLIEVQFARRYSLSQIYRILIRLGFSRQRPTSLELEHDGAVIWRWKAPP